MSRGCSEGGRQVATHASRSVRHARSRANVGHRGGDHRRVSNPPTRKYENRSAQVMRKTHT